MTLLNRQDIVIVILRLFKCNICNDGLIITNEEDIYKNLKLLYVSQNPNITDESIINLIKRCHKLEYILVFSVVPI